MAQAQAIALTVTDSASPASTQAGQTARPTAKITTVYNHTNWRTTSTVSRNTFTAQVLDGQGNFLKSAETVPTASSPPPPAASNCPQGSAYLPLGDGCRNAQSAGSVQRANYFTGFVQGVTYPARPPWNVPAVDYAVGYSGTLKDPSRAGDLPACVSHYNANTLIANADIQPCVLDHFDFTLNGGYCFMVTGTGGHTVTFFNDHFAAGTSNCTQYAGWITLQAGSTANVLVKYSEFDDNYSCNCGGAITTSGTGDIMVAYSAALGVTGRFENVNSGASGSIHNQYNYIEGIGNGYEHGEVVEINTANPFEYDDIWNNYYAASANCCDTALLYVTSAAPGPNGPGTMTSANVSYNVLIARPNPKQNNSVTVSAPIWVDTNFTNTIGALAINNNYIDASGSYLSIFVYPPNGTGSIGSASCSGNKSLMTGAAITGNRGSSTSAMVCK